MMKRVALAAAILTAAVATGFAHSGAKGVVKERMELMKSSAASMKAIGQMMKGEVDYVAETVAAEARKIATHGGDALTKAFPEGSLDHPSEALPAIWRDWSRFEALAADLEFYAAGLAAAAGNERDAAAGGRLGAGLTGPARPTADELAAMPPDVVFQKLAGACADCHESFRLKKN